MKRREGKINSNINKKQIKGGIMKKENKISKIIVFMLLLTIIAMILVSNTYSKYATNASGSDSVVVAKWSFLVNGEEIAVTGDAKTIEFGLFDTIYDSDGENEETDVAEGFIAPGTSGAFEFELQNTSEVTAQYGIDFEVTNENDIPIEYSLDGENWNTELSDIDFSEDTILNVDSNTEIINIQWRWTFDGNNSEDTELGKLATTDTVPEITISATVNAIQVNKGTPFYLDLTENTVALMSYYMPNAKLTYYGGLSISEISVYAEEAGTLNIGTAKVSDIVTARTTGTTYTSSTTAYDVVKGQNTISLSLDVAEDETIVLGGNNSVAIGYVSGSTSTDENGIFTTIDGNSHTEVLNTNDKLSIEVKISEPEIITEDQAVFSGLTSNVSNSTIAKLISVHSEAGPFAYANTGLFAEKTISKIGIPVKSVSALDENQTFTLYVINADAITNNTPATVKNTYELTLPLSELGSSTTVNKWVYVDLSNYNIVLNENETLAFGSTTDTVAWGFSQSTPSDNTYEFKTLVLTDEIAEGKWEIYFDIYTATTTSTGSVNIDEHIANLEAKEEAAKSNNDSALKVALTGKNFSILGDSISTFKGYSNDDTNTNSTIGSNAVWYTGSTGGVTSVDETWWMQTINETGMNLLVNNSYSGSRLSNNDKGAGSAGYLRATELHDDTGENAGTNPDIIALWLGINDVNNGVSLGTYSEDLYSTLITDNGDETYTYATPSNFTEAYIITVHKLITTYETADVFAFTFLPNKYANATKLEPFNEVVENVANYYGIEIVDLYNDSGITYDNYKEYCDDSEELHPNPAGMDLITKTFVDALSNKYVN